MKKWKQKEKQDAKDFGGKVVRGSGNQWFRPGDVKTERFLIENKTTHHESFSITQKLWTKIWVEATLNHRIPLLSLKLEQENTELVVLSKNDFLTLLQLTTI